MIEHNQITDTRRATIDLEPNGPEWGAENVHILDNRIGPGRLLFLAAAGGRTRQRGGGGAERAAWGTS